MSSLESRSETCAWPYREDSSNCCPRIGTLRWWTFWECGGESISGWCRKIVLRTGDWVLIHVGFAMSKIGEADALDQMRMLTELGEQDAAMEEVQGYGLGESDEDDPQGWPVKFPAKGSKLMRFVDEFRDPALITRTADEIRRLANPATALPLSWKCAAATLMPSTASD